MTSIVTPRLARAWGIRRLRNDFLNGETMTQIYQIRVRGHLSKKRAEWFDGLSIENQPNGETLLTGPIPDQAALHGLLVRIRDVGLPLLSVLQVEPEKDMLEEENP
jgi:hypothetical protein